MGSPPILFSWKRISEGGGDGEESEQVQDSASLVPDKNKTCQKWSELNYCNSTYIIGVTVRTSANSVRVLCRSVQGWSETTLDLDNHEQKRCREQKIYFKRGYGYVGGRSPLKLDEEAASERFEPSGYWLN